MLWDDLMRKVAMHVFERVGWVGGLETLVDISSLNFFSRLIIRR